MFDELDPPEGFTPSPSFHASVSRGVTRRRRTRRLATGALGAVAVLLVVSAGAFAYGAKRWDDTQRVDVAATNPAPLGDGPFTVLVAGVDGSGPNRRADSVAMVRVDPAGKVVRVLSLPRDLYVPIDGGASNRLAQSLTIAGPDGLVTTVEQVTGIDVDRYVEVTDQGLARIVDAMGGVGILTDGPVRSTRSSLDLAGPACTKLDGATAVALARARDLNTLSDGQWVQAMSGDGDRVTNQQVLALAFFRAVPKLSSNPVRATKVIDTALSSVTIDSAWSAAELRRLLSALPGAEFTGSTLVTLDKTLSDGASVLVPDPARPDARLLLSPAPPAGTATDRVLEPGEFVHPTSPLFTPC